MGVKIVTGSFYLGFFCRRQLTGREGPGVGGVGEKPSGVRPQALTVRLCRNAEFTPSGGGIRAAGHPRHQRRLGIGVRGAAGNLLTVPLPGPGERTPGRGVTCLPMKQVGLALTYPTVFLPNNQYT